MPDHALLSASSSYRWLACPPSARLCAAKSDKGSEYARQGTEAHTLAAFKVLKALGHQTYDPSVALISLWSFSRFCAMLVMAKASSG